MTKPRAAVALFAGTGAELGGRTDWIRAFEPGDVQLLNNHLICHARTRHDDLRERDCKRLRLAVAGSRTLPRGYELLFGSISETHGPVGGEP